jgi:hypothetical protein
MGSINYKTSRFENVSCIHTHIDLTNKFVLNEEIRLKFQFRDKLKRIRINLKLNFHSRHSLVTKKQCFSFPEAYQLSTTWSSHQSTLYGQRMHFQDSSIHRIIFISNSFMRFFDVVKRTSIFCEKYWKLLMKKRGNFIRV